MRKSILLLVATMMVSYSCYAQAYNLTDTELKQHLNFSITSNHESTHYIRPLVINAKNISGKRIKVTIDNGLIFVPEDKDFQPFVITRQEVITLNPGQQVKRELYGMCTNSSLSSPYDELTYVVGERADSSLVRLTRWIEKDSLYNAEAQYAVWALTCNRRLEDIVGFDTLLVNDFIHYLADVTKQETPPPPDPNDYRRNYYYTKYKRTMSGEFNCSYPDTRAVSIAMFNKDNVIVRELYNNPEMPPGNHKLSFEFDASVYDDDYYFIRVIENGSISIDLKLETLKQPGGQG